MLVLVSVKTSDIGFDPFGMFQKIRLLRVHLALNLQMANLTERQ